MAKPVSKEVLQVISFLFQAGEEKDEQIARLTEELKQERKKNNGKENPKAIKKT